MARPRTLTADLIAEIVDVIGPGVRRKDAALAAGVSEAAYYKWIARGNREMERMLALGLTDPDPTEAVFVEFVEATTHAWHQAKAKAIRTIVHAGDDDWRAMAWWLERTYPIEYGRQRVVIERADLVDPLEGADQSDVADALADAAEAYLAQQTD